MPTTPTVIVGAERSGTTLFRLLIDSHPDITCIEGLDYVVNSMTPSGPAVDVATFEAGLVTETVFSTSGFTIDTSLPDLVAVANDLVSQRMHASGKTSAAFLTHTKLREILAIWPDARFIHLVRDPRGVANSAKVFEWGTDVHYGTSRWMDLVDEWQDVAGGLADDRTMQITFEELVTDPRATLDRVCEFLGHSFDEEMYSYAGDTDYARPDAGRATAWRNELSDKEIQVIEATVGDRLTSLGYEPSGLPATTISPSDLTRARAKMRVLQWKHKLGAFGIYGVGELVARKAGIDRIQLPLKKKMNAAERARRKKSWRAPGREYAYSPQRARELGVDPSR